METFKTGDICPKPGNYERIETGEIMWTEKGDEFAPYYEKNQTTPKRAHFKFIDDNPA